MNEVDGDSESENDSYDDFDPQDSIHRHSLQNNQDLLYENQSDIESEISTSENAETSELSETEPEKSIDNDDSDIQKEPSEKDDDSDNDDVETEPPFKKQKLLQQD